MAPRRGPPPGNTLSSQDPPSTSSPAFLFPRTASPSSGFSQFLSKPSKWFGWNASNSRMSTATSEPRSSASSGRKPKISHPTDPRPIVNSLQPDVYMAPAARSVLELSSTSPAHSLDIPTFQFPGSASSPPSPSSGSGDLRNISHRTWSKSADDLGKMSTGKLPPINVSFQEKITQYRNRTNSNASGYSPASVSPVPSPAAHQPFSTIGTPGSSPPHCSSDHHSGISISVSAPTVELGSSSKAVPASVSHVHIRSHSFTPRLSSKLTPRFGPTSPKRKGSAPLEREHEKNKDGRDAGGFINAGVASSVAARGAFASKSNHHQPQQEVKSNNLNHSTASLPLLAVASDQVDDHEETGKRSSQIVLYSGFINRQSNPPPALPYSANYLSHSSLALSKGWKPFKLELKGSKLYFYKPPGDRSAAIKDLFPTDLVPVARGEEDVIGEEEEPEDKPKGSTVGRKKRSYWGRKTHPDLVLNGEKIDHGTLEALVHEAVFATRFRPLPVQGDPAGVEEPMESWRDFASAVLLCLPRLAGQQRFEVEFTRCCAYLVSGAEEGIRGKECTRVEWLAGEYVRHHGGPADQAAWDRWRAETIPNFSFLTVHRSTPIGIPNSTSTQAIFTLSPEIGVGSPNLGTFSPRPNENKIRSLAEALGVSQKSQFESSAPNSPRPQHATTNGQIPWTTLEQDGLTREILLHLDPHFIAQCLCLFHRSVLERIPDDLTADMAFISENASFTLDSNGPSASAPDFVHFFGANEHPHWLTRLILLQILGIDGSGTYLPPNSFSGKIPEERQSHGTRTHRSEVISVWIKIGELSRLAGDECSWRAIEAALCSRPVARLEKVWRRVDPQALAVLESWVYIGLDGEPVTVHEPKVTPWGGDVKFRIEDEANKARKDGYDEIWDLSALEKIRDMFCCLRTSFSLCQRKTAVNGDGTDEDMTRMVAFWRDMACCGGSRSSAACKFTRIDHFTALSIAAEPPHKGSFEPYFWTRPLQTSRNALLPLLFPEVLPGVGFVDRTPLFTGRPTHDLYDLHILHGLTPQLRPSYPGRDPSADRDGISRGVGYGGTIIPVYNGELLVIVQNGGDSPSTSVPPSRSPSRPPSSITDHGLVEKNVSRAPSFRVKPGSSHGLERKTSAARRNSLPSISHRQSFIVPERSSEPPLRVVVLAGSLDRLVDILVFGLQNISVSVADDNGEMSLKEGKTRDLVVDCAEFGKVWWNTFRSFVVPLVFFELLRKIYIRQQPRFSHPSITEYLAVASARSEVLEVMKEWLCVGGGAQDALDDVQLFDSLSSFLSSSVDHSIVGGPNSQDPAALKAWCSLEETRTSVSQLFTWQTRMPKRVNPAQPVVPPKAQTFVQGNAFDIDRIGPENLVEHLDAMARAAFSNVSEEDLFMTSDLLEVQTADRIAWLPNRELNWNEETIEIQTIHLHLQQVEPSSLFSEQGRDTFYRLLPPSIRSCIRAYGILRKWLISKLVVPNLGIRLRQARMDLFLRAIEIARSRSPEGTSSSLPLGELSCTRSFVEAVLSSAVLSQESRLHQRAWQNLALHRGVPCESLASFISKPYTEPLNSTEPLTVDIGWIIERILEIIATPDIVESASIDAPQSLINFHKRRHLCNFILNAPVNHSRTIHLRDDVIRRSFERLNILEREVNLFQFDHRGIKEEAYRECAQTVVNANMSAARRFAKPFHKLIASQIEKNRRDKILRDRLVKEKRLEDSRNVRREELFNKAMKPSKASDFSQKQRRNKKSMSSAFMQFMRPISSAFTSDTLNLSGVKRSPSELDFVPTGKPSLVLNLVDARVAQFINTERSFTFQLDTEDGGHYLLQAIDRKDMVKWMETISRVANIVAKRRLTYLGDSPQPHPADHIHSNSITASRDLIAVFGVELEFLLQREAEGHDVQPGTIPSIIQRCLEEIELRGLKEVGIYRIPGAATEINALKDGFNRGKSPIDPSTDVYAVCDLVKAWFRVLPQPVFPASSYYEIIEAAKLENLDSRLLSIRRVVQDLPQANFDLLRRISEHLDKITDYEEHNQMTAEALAIVFSPNLMRAPHNDFGMVLSNMGYTHKLVKALITHFHVIFEDDQEVEMEADDEYDSPILEEDEDEEIEMPTGDPDSSER